MQAGAAGQPHNAANDAGGQPHPLGYAGKLATLFIACSELEPSVCTHGSMFVIMDVPNDMVRLPASLA